MSKTGGYNFGPIFIAIAAFLWTTDVVIRTSLTDYFTSEQIVFMEHVFIVLVISPLIIRYGSRFREFRAKDFFALTFIGVGGSALATIALTAGFQLGEPFQFAAVVIMLQQTQPIIAIGLAHIILKEKLPPYYYPLSALSIAGVYMIIFPYLTNFTAQVSNLVILSDQLKDPLGIQAALLGFTAAVLWGSSTVFGKYLMNHSKLRLKYKEMTVMRFLVALIFLTVLLLVYPLVSRSSYPSVNYLLANPRNIYELLYISLVVGLLALFIYYLGLRSTHASVATLFELAYPLSFFVILPLLRAKSLLTIQYVGSFVLIFSTTAISFLYSKSSAEESLTLDTEA